MEVVYKLDGVVVFLKEGTHGLRLLLREGMRTRVAVRASVVRVAPVVSIVPIDIDSLGCYGAVQVAFVFAVVVLALEDELSGFVIGILDGVRSINVQNGDHEQGVSRIHKWLPLLVNFSCLVIHLRAVNTRAKKWVFLVAVGIEVVVRVLGIGLEEIKECVQSHLYTDQLTSMMGTC